MNFERTAIPDVVICKPDIYGDPRGYFMESFRGDHLSEFLGYSVDFCQDNESSSSFGVLRGLHYQLPPFAQTKLVRVLVGKVLDVAVDMRKGSPTFGESVAVELSSENKHQLFIPRGFAHGFVVLSESATFFYKCDNYYAPEFDTGLAFDDPELKIDWRIKLEEMMLSEKDKNQPSFSNAKYFDFDQKLYSK
ncbi:dTDP-4-dehydrorhamnose 3,5-epimerase [Leeuwenhoekiella sp. NPDC079379]|uniref:dTDP-4-dehydrorhamnose 3,5-epimerase n=1 Tax=Leeuwenhoekiella sp. NPDC079379 TaxID=3364122 RepID=UPI0037C635F4